MSFHEKIRVSFVIAHLNYWLGYYKYLDIATVEDYKSVLF